MDEFIQEGKYASHETLKGYAYSWQTLSLLMQEVITNGMYVPEFLPDENQPVLLVVIKEATVLKAKSLHSEAPEVLISIASHTGESVRDDDNGYYADYWRLAAGTIKLIDCAEDTVFWLPSPLLEHGRHIASLAMAHRLMPCLPHFLYSSIWPLLSSQIKPCLIWAPLST
ncbi:hypothetical protein ACSZNO_06335 [Aeromonas veronii]